MPLYKEKPKLTEAEFFGGGIDDAIRIVRWLKKWDINCSWVPAVGLDEHGTGDILIVDDAHNKYQQKVPKNTWMMFNPQWKRGERILLMSQEQFNDTYQYVQEVIDAAQDQA